MITVVDKTGQRMPLTKFMRREAAIECSQRLNGVTAIPEIAVMLTTTRRERKRADMKKDRYPRIYRMLRCPSCGHEYMSRAVRNAACVECGCQFNPAMNRVMT
ncbi:MAG: hypothetical protein BWY95_01154 [Bacteroidetes bacterium ADurb.BinA104]|nr:MAG: hypothetical protein BWY95_01154 [Bacteroidetes bacterium ADurb.BinA104]